MSKIKSRKFLTLILSLICAVLLGCAILLPKKISASAFKTTGTDVGQSLLVSSDDLFDSKSNGLNTAVLDTLAGKILGSGKKTTDLITAAKSSPLDSSSFRSSNGGSDVTVKLGGLIWTPVYLSETTGGVPIITLWLSGINASGKYSYSSDFSQTQDISPLTDGWNSTTSSAASWNTPSEMYGSSYMRAVTLNNGGYYSSVHTVGTSAIGDHSTRTAQPDITDVSAYAASDTNNKFYNFTRGALSQFIVAPFEVDWQGDQKNSVTQVVNSNINLNNESYNSVGNINSSANFEGKTYNDGGTTVDLYGQWKNDKVWLPSLTEVGNTNGTNGIWKCSTSQRQTDKAAQWSSVKSSGTGKGVYNYTWLRTGVSGNLSLGYYILADGTVRSTGEPWNAFCVRPAIHLALDRIPEPADIATTTAYDGTAKAVTYNGAQQTLAYLSPDWYTAAKSVLGDTSIVETTYEFIPQGDTSKTFNSPTLGNDGIQTALKVAASNANDLKNAGQYKVTLKLKCDMHWFNDTTDYSTASADQIELAKTRVVKFTIAQKEAKYTLDYYDGGGNVVAANSSVYDGKTVKVEPNFASDQILAADKTAVLNAIKIYYKCTNNYGNTDIDTTLTDDSGNDSDGNPLNLGSSVKPYDRGDYVANFYYPDAAKSNYKFVTDGSGSLNFKITPKPITLPTINNNNAAYTGSDIEFLLDNYDAQKMSVDSGNLPSGLSWDTSDLKFKAIDSGSYTAKVKLIDTNYIWQTDGGQSEDDQQLVVCVEKAELGIKFTSPLAGGGFNLKTNTTGNIGLSFDTDKGPATRDGAVEEPEFNLFYTFNDGSKKKLGSGKMSDLTLDVTDLKGENNKFTAGTYTLTFELAPDTVTAVNKNYKLGASATQVVTVTAGEASIDDIGILYTTKTIKEDGGLPAAIPSGGLKYSYDTAKKAAEEYYFLFDFSLVDFLEQVGECTYEYSDGTNIVSKAGEVTVTAKIKVKEAEQGNHKLPDSYDVTAANKFIDYQYNGDGTATLKFKVEIGKATLTLTGSEIPLMYKIEGGTITPYDPKNPPEYTGKPVTVTLGAETLYPHGVKSVKFDELSGKAVETNAKNYTIGATVTLDSNHVTADGHTSMHVDIPWEIAKELIKLTDNWGTGYIDEYLNDTTVAHLQIPQLGLTDAQAKYIKYTFYKEVDGAMSDTPLTTDELKELSTTDRFTDSIKLYIKAELTEEGLTKYRLEEVSAGSGLNPKLFSLGEKKTLIKLTINDALKNLSYGTDVDAGTLISLVNDVTGDEWSKDYYEARVFCGEEDKGLLSDFDFKSAAAGEYKIVININSDYSADYALDKSNIIKFDIARKAIDLPTVSEIVFSGEYINLVDYLGGSYADYKDIIEVGGTDYKDIRNVSAQGYNATLTLTDSNYCWAYPDTAETVKLLMRGKASYEVSPVDEATAAYKWNISPLMIDASNMWNKGKNGATLNLPEGVNKLITGETLAVNYRYYDDAGQFIESPELKGGKSFRVEAVLGGIDAEQGNVVFKAADGTLGAASERISYTVPQSGAAAFFGNALSWAKSNWWILVAIAAALIFLIILICIIAHRRKTKEIREEKKAAKEEEKRRRETERELEKAKAEAELAKMRASVGLGAGAAGMALAAQQQPVQQPVQQQPQQQQLQPMQQQQPQYPQYPQYMPQQQYGDPVMINELARLKAENEMRLKVELERARAEAERAKAEAEIARRSGMMPQYFNAQGLKDGEQGSIPMDVLGALVVSALKNMAGNGGLPKLDEPKPVLSQSTDETVISTPTVYPPDAVITTTTTVDTTKSKTAEPVSRDSGRDRNFDIDGFYDTFDVDKK